MLCTVLFHVMYEQKLGIMTVRGRNKPTVAEATVFAASVSSEDDVRKSADVKL